MIATNHQEPFVLLLFSCFVMRSILLMMMMMMTAVVILIRRTICQYVLLVLCKSSQGTHSREGDDDYADQVSQGAAGG